jgi:PPK2 family polyphosphate:nucleotide phosphotransferase
VTGRHAFVNKMIAPLRVAPGGRVDLGHQWDPSDTFGTLTKDDAEQRLAEGVELLSDYQQRLAAQDTYAVLLIIQGIDAAGKDGTIKHVMSGVNPQGVDVHSFKTPSAEELNHDYLWRYQCKLPARGRIGIFNRSHYEEVLVVRVHPDQLAQEQLPAAHPHNHLWERRYREINDWERYLSENGVQVVKVFLHISRDEQERRLLARIDDPAHNWKFSPADLAEREHWREYQDAFSEMLSNTSSDWAPWHIVPANHKWFARAATASVLVGALAHINPQYPTLDDDARARMADARRELAGDDEGA